MELAAGLDPEPGDLLTRGKRRDDAFVGTDLDVALRSHGVENLLMTGVCTDIYVNATAQHARNLDHRRFVLRDLVAATTPAFGLHVAAAASD